MRTAASGAIAYSWIAHDQPITALGWTGDGTLASGAKDGTVRLWQPGKENAKELKTLTGHAHPITFLAGSPAPNTNYLASGAADGTVILWHALTGDKIFELKGHDGPISALSFYPSQLNAPPGPLLVATRTGMVVVWQLPAATKQPQVLNAATWLP